MIKVFDLDGTLLDSNQIWRDIDNEFVTRRGFELTDEYNEFVSHAIFPVAAKYTKAYYNLIESEESIMREWHEMAYQGYAKDLPLKPDVLAYLDKCKEKQERMVIYTSSEPELCQAAIKNHNLQAYFEDIIFAQALSLEKKYTSSFLTLAERFDEKPEDCILFDDSPVACTAAKKAGWTVIGMKDNMFEASWPELQSVCHVFCDGFGQLL